MTTPTTRAAAAHRAVRIRENTGARGPEAIKIAAQLAEAVDPESLDGRRDAVWRAFNKAHGSDDGMNAWVEELYLDRVIARIGEDLYAIPYTIEGEDRTVTLGEKSKVKLDVEYTPIEEAATERHTETRLTGVGILEAVDEEGWIWKVTIVRPGTSRNGYHYTPEVLAEAAPLYEGAKAFDGHRDDATRRSSAVGSMLGWYSDVAPNPHDGSLQANFQIAESAPHIRQLFLSAWRNDRPDLIGFSHDIGAVKGQATIREGGRSVTPIRKIVTVHSVDIVADPSAGGRLERIVASTQGEDQPMTLAEFLRRLRAGSLSETEITEAYEAHPEWREVAEAVTETSGSGETDTDTGTEPVTEAGGLDELTRSMLIREAFARHGLPEAAHEALRTQLETDQADAATISRTVREAAGIWQAALAAGPQPLPGQGGRVETRDRQGDLQPALDGLLLGRAVNDAEGNPVRPFRSLKEAYSAFTGRHPYDAGDEDYNRWLLAESVGAVPYPGARITESLTSASWAEALGDSITRRMVSEYSLPALNTWRQIVSDITGPSDFRTNRRTRIGGYNVLPTVAEGDPYTALTSPADEEATFAISKKGGTEDYTLEMVANDDVQALRRIPQKLGRAAALTLYRAIWVTTIEGNAAIYDTNNLFDEANHGNLATAPQVLGETAIGLLRQKMVTQTVAGETSGFLGATPRYLAVPAAKYVEAYKLTQSAVAVVGSGEAATTPNPWQGLVPIEVPVFTNDDDWYLIADPTSIPTIEVGFYQGREDPELFVQDQPTVGTVFTHDKFTWKIRHIWGLTVLDYRGFQKGDAVA